MHARLDWLSEHVSYADGVRTQVREDNTPDLDQLQAMQHLCSEIIEPLWKKTGGKIRINSLFRSPKVNKAVGGSKGSQHMKGEAVDLDAVHPLTNKQLLNLVLALPTWDQVIEEYPVDGEPSWVHISYRRGGPNRKQVIRIG